MTDKIRKRTGWALPLFLALSACSGADPGTPSEGSAEVVEESSGVVLATVMPSDHQKIEVIEYADDLIGVIETYGPKFDPNTPLSLQNYRGGLAEFYSAVAGESVDVNVLEKLGVYEALAAAKGLAERPEVATKLDHTLLTHAADGIADSAEGAAADVHTLALDCAQDGLHYTRFSSGWAGTNCATPPGLEDPFCSTNKPYIEKGWTHAEIWEVRTHNMSVCNTAKWYVYARKTGHFVSYGHNALGFNSGGSGRWVSSNRDWTFLTRVEHVSGNEQAHLNLATFRQW